MRARRWAAALLAPALLAAFTGRAGAGEIAVAGWIENVRLGAEGIVVAAKLDTGADTSSLHATDIQWARRGDDDWVGFEVIGADGAKAHFERKVVRIARVRRASGGTQKRPVVLMGVCLGRVYRETEVNLTDRSGFNYEFLVGRSFLAGRFAVDSARTRTVDPACAETRKP